jgi:exonuclease SbcC
MRPLRLAIENLTAFNERQPAVDLAGFDLFAIAGPTGSGKSSLLDAIVFALYGRVPRMGKSISELISLGRDRMAVTLDFRSGERTFRISRVARRGRGADAQMEELTSGLERPMADGVNEVNRQVGTLLGLGYDAFTQAVILPQGEFARFLRSRPGEQRAILRDLLRLQVYEKMRERSGKEATRLEIEVRSHEAILGTEYAGATPEAITALEERRTALGRTLLELRRQTAEDDARFAELHRRHEKTRELCAKRRLLAGLEARAGEVAELDRRLQAARRAAAVLPRAEALAQAETSERTAGSRLEQALVSARMATERQQTAQAALEAAESGTAEIPALDERLQALDEVRGLLGPRDDARRRHERTLGELAQRGQALDSARQAQASGKQELAGLEARLAEVQQEIATLGYDAARHERLDGLRDAAASLSSQRAAASRSAQTFAEAERDLERAYAEGDRLTVQARAAADRLDAAHRRWEQADEAVRQAERDHAAAHLRTTLRKGEACPVCDRRVQHLPALVASPLLTEIAGRREDAREAETAASRLEADAREAAARAMQAAAQAAEQRDQAGRQHSAAESALREGEASLRAAAGADLPDAHDAPEDSLRAALQALADQRQRHERAAAGRDLLERRQEAARHSSEQAAQSVRTLTETVADLTARAADVAADLQRLDERISTVAKGVDPVAERERLAQRRASLETARGKAQREEREAVSALAAAQSSLEEGRRGLEAARQALSSTRAAAEATLREAGFRDAGEARAAALAHQDQQRLEQQIDTHRQERHSLASRVEELGRELTGSEVSDEDLAEAEAARKTRRDAFETAASEDAALDQRLQHLHERARSGAALAKELSERRRRHAIHRRLSEDLRSENFQAFLLEEAFRELVSGASERLLELSGRYTLDFHEDAFHVLDHDHAGERRSAETLSGGETFLASLALALELSQQVQRAAGAVHLDSLFIDEGFGTLDPETLETISDAILNLPRAGRMVGIITHLPELTERLPARIQVEKRPEGSRARVLIS